jgi:hypothetical protein
VTALVVDCSKGGCYEGVQTSIESKDSIEGDTSIQVETGIEEGW